MAGENDDDILDIMNGIPNDDTLDDDLPNKAGDDDEDLGIIQFDDDEEDGKAKAGDDEEDEGLQAIVFDDDGEIEDNDGDPDDDDFEEDDKSTSSFQKRLGREQRLKTVAYKRAEDLATANDYLIERLTKAEAGQLTVRRDAASMTKTVLDGYEESLNEQIRLAQEMGDEEASRKAWDALREVQKGQATADQMLANAPTDEQIARYRPQNIPQVQSQPRVNAMAQDWIDNNGWFNDPKHTAKRAAVIAIDNQLAASGIDKGSAEYYRKLSIKVAQEFPTLEVHSHDGRKVKRADPKDGGRKRGGNTKKRDTSGSAKSRAPVVQRKGGGKVIRLTGAQRDMMESLGLDFSNKEHVAEFRRNHT